MRRVTVRGALLVASAVVGILGFTTDVLRSPRAVVRDAVEQLSQPLEREIRLLVDVRADRARVGKRAHHLQLRAGPGPLRVLSSLHPQLSFPFHLFLDQRGLTLTFRGAALVRDGASYLRFAEMPPLGFLQRALEGRWLQFGDTKEETAGAPGASKEVRRFVRQAFESGGFTRVQRGRSVVIRGVRTRSYRLVVEGDRLQEFFDRLAGQAPLRQGSAGQAEVLPAVAAASRYLAGRLRVLKVEQAEMWVRPHSHELVRARLVLVPKEAAAEVQRVTLDVTLLPRRGGTVPPAPRGAVKLRPETLQKIVGR